MPHQAGLESQPMNQVELDKIHNDVIENLNQNYFNNNAQRETNRHYNYVNNNSNSDIKYENPSENFQMSMSENYYSDNFHKADEDVNISENNN